LAHLTNNSLTSFKRKFKDFYKSSPAVYIKAKRLEKAVDLLKYSDQSISDISFNCAFNDIAYFSNSFKQKYGSTPSNFRLDEKPKS
jgi:AraC-like DNA-binding protein